MSFGKAMECPFTVNGVSPPTIYLTIPPLFELASLIWVYILVGYYCVVILWESGALWVPPNSPLSGGSGDSRLNWYDILSICM